MTTIWGERTTLRPVVPADLDLLAGWLADPEVYVWWGGKPVPRETVAEKYLGEQPDVACFIVEARGVEARGPGAFDGPPIGYIQYWIGDEGPSASDGPAPTAAPAPDTGGLVGGIDMFLIPSARGQGLGSDAARAMVQYLFGALGWRRVTVDPAADNVRAIGAWEKAGFSYECDWPDHPDGPAVLLAINADAGVSSRP